MGDQSYQSVEQDYQQTVVEIATRKEKSRRKVYVDAIRCQWRLAAQLNNNLRLEYVDSSKIC